MIATIPMASTCPPKVSLLWGQLDSSLNTWFLGLMWI